MKSPYKGVSWDKSRNKWLAWIKVGGKQMTLGRFTDVEDAHKARVAAEDKYLTPYQEWEPMDGTVG